jgi:biotin transport system substrate-specific component
MADAAATLRHAAFHKGGGVGVLVDAFLILAGALLVALAAQIEIPLPFTPVPITGQTLAVLLVGSSLGAWRGGSSLLLYLVLGGVGLPFYSGGDRGWEVVQGATGGYLIGFILAAIVTGALAERRWDRRVRSSIGAMLTGNVIIYLVGLPWLAVVLDTGLEKTLEFGLYPFVPGDMLKLYLAALALPGAWKLLGRDSTRSEP